MFSLFDRAAIRRNETKGSYRPMRVFTLAEESADLNLNFLKMNNEFLMFRENGNFLMIL